MHTTNKRHSRSIGIVITGRIEALIFQHHLLTRKILKLGKYKVIYFRLNQYDVFVVCAGKKLNDAALAASLLIAKTGPELLISFGTGAAFGTEMNTGDVLFANSVTMLENGVFDQYRILSSLRSDVRQFVFDIVFGFKASMYVGTLITTLTDEPLLHADKIKFPHPVLDTSMCPVAQVAARRQVTALALRGITHSVTATGGRDLQTLMDYKRLFDPKGFLISLARHPGLFFQLPRYLRQTLKASDRGAGALWSLLQVLSLNVAESVDESAYHI